MNKIVVTGPESSGKTTLSRALAEELQTLWLPEYARFYLSRYGPAYEQEDLLRIARGQRQWEETWSRHSPHAIILDTSMLVLKIWSEYKYASCHPWILEQLEGQPADLYLLCRPDMPWEPDPLRENRNDRSILFERYQKELEHYGFPYIILSGSLSQRLEHSMKKIRTLIKK